MIKMTRNEKEPKHTRPFEGSVSKCNAPKVFQNRKLKKIYKISKDWLKGLIAILKLYFGTS